MKRFIWLLVLAAAAYAVYKYYPELEKRARQQTAPAEEQADPADQIQTAVRTSRSAPGTPAVESPQAKADEIEKRYPLPQFKTIEQLTGDWKAIPASAFPREVTLKEMVAFQLTGAGTAQVNAGTKVVALSGKDGAITLAPNQSSPLRAQVNVEKTDLKDVLRGVYDKFKERERAKVLKAREMAKAEAQKASSGAQLVLGGGKEAPATAQAKIGPRPEQKTDGSIAFVIQNINERTAAKKEAEPKLKDISSWGPVTYREWDGQPYWCSSVRYTARTIFGEFPTEAWALIQNGRVQKWVYAGTGEPLP